MKRLLVLFIVLVTVLSLVALPISAEEAEENKGFFEAAGDFFATAGEFFKNAAESIGLSTNLFHWEIIHPDKDIVDITIRNGGFNYINQDSQINQIIDIVYKVIYPIGFIIMLLCWGFGIAKSTISVSLDFKDKHSIVNSIISLIIGLAAMSLAPKILTLLTGVSQWLCNSLFDQAIFSSISDGLRLDGLTIQSIITATSNESLFASIVLLVVDLIFMINILWIALLQCLSPIFIGLMASEGTRKIGYNFIKEYLKALLVPSVTLIYFFLAVSLTKVTHAGGIIVALVLAISTLGIAGKKLDKLIN